MINNNSGVKQVRVREILFQIFSRSAIVDVRESINSASGYEATPAFSNRTWSPRLDSIRLIDVRRSLFELLNTESRLFLFPSQFSFPLHIIHGYCKKASKWYFDRRKIHRDIRKSIRSFENENSRYRLITHNVLCLFLKESRFSFSIKFHSCSRVTRARANECFSMHELSRVISLWENENFYD